MFLTSWYLECIANDREKRQYHCCLTKACFKYGNHQKYFRSLLKFTTNDCFHTNVALRLASLLYMFLSTFRIQGICPFSCFWTLSDWCWIRPAQRSATGTKRGMRSLPMKILPSRRSTLAQLETKSKFDPKFLISQNSSFWIQDIYEALFKQQQVFEICATNMSQIIVYTSCSKYGDHIIYVLVSCVWRCREMIGWKLCMCIWNVPIHRICESFSWQELALRYHSSVRGLQEDQVSWKGDKIIWWGVMSCHVWKSFDDNVTKLGVRWRCYRMSCYKWEFYDGKLKIRCRMLNQAQDIIRDKAMWQNHEGRSHKTLAIYNIYLIKWHKQLQCSLACGSQATYWYTVQVVKQKPYIWLVTYSKIWHPS